MSSVEVPRVCLICGAGVESKGKGRPPSYCSTACRRMAERDIRRANDTITKLEDFARTLRNPMVSCLVGTPAQLQFVASELADARKRLRQLLADD